MLVTFSLSIAAGINIYVLIKKFSIVHIMAITAIIFVYVFPLLNTSFMIADMEEYNSYYYDVVKEDTIETRTMGKFDYLPLKAVNNIPYIANRTDDAIVLEGNATLRTISKNGTSMEIEASSFTKNTVIELPYIYYIGYNVKLIKYEQEINLKPEESENGFVQVNLEDTGKVIIKVKYTGTILMKTTLIVTIISIIGFTVYCVRRKHE